MKSGTLNLGQFNIEPTMRRIALVSDPYGFSPSTIAHLQKWQTQTPISLSVLKDANPAKTKTAAMPERKASMWSEPLLTVPPRVQFYEKDTLFDSLEILSRYNDLLVMERGFFIRELAEMQTESFSRLNCPLFIPPATGQTPATTLLFASPPAIKTAMALQPYLFPKNNMIVVAEEERDHQNDRYLMAYVQAYIPKPGFLTLPEDEPERMLRHYVQPSTLVVGHMAGDRTLVSWLGQWLALPASDSLSFLLIF